MGNRVYIETRDTDDGLEVSVNDNYDDSGWILVEPGSPIDPVHNPFEVLRLVMDGSGVARDILEAAQENDTQVVLDGESLKMEGFFGYAKAQEASHAMDNALPAPPESGVATKPKVRL